MVIILIYDRFPSYHCLLSHLLQKIACTASVFLSLNINEWQSAALALWRGWDTPRIKNKASYRMDRARDLRTTGLFWKYDHCRIFTMDISMSLQRSSNTPSKKTGYFGGSCAHPVVSRVALRAPQSKFLRFMKNASPKMQFKPCVLKA
jgi:hypothetical protein